MNDLTIVQQDHVLLDPLNLDAKSTQEYIHSIPEFSTEKLQDDYLAIWFLMPKEGYGDLHAFVTEIRLIIIDTLLKRPRIAPRARITVRYPDIFREDSVPASQPPPGYGRTK